MYYIGSINIKKYIRKNISSLINLFFKFYKEIGRLVWREVVIQNSGEILILTLN